jgi:hypothetical protein
MQILHVNRFPTKPFDLAKAQHACSHHANNMPSVLRCDRTLFLTTDHRIARTIEEQVKLLHHQDNTTTMIAKAHLDNLALFNNRIAAHALLSNRYLQTMEINGNLQTTHQL